MLLLGMTMNDIDPQSLLTPRRRVMGISAVLLPLKENGEADWPGFNQHLVRTVEAGLVPAINMDTGYGMLLTQTDRRFVAAQAQSILKGQRFCIGACVPDQHDLPYNRSAYLEELNFIHAMGGIPVITQSHGLTSLPDEELIRAYEDLAQNTDQFIAFELGRMFAPFGKIYSLTVIEAIMQIPNCVGIKHSSLSREQEWQRLVLRNKVRPEFRLFTGNDLAIDMIMYGSDYLLGLSTFAPQLFGLRDKYWATGDVRFHELNDKLQYLGAFAFRPPVPAYKHSAAQFLHQRGWISTPQTHRLSMTRPESDLPILQDIAESLGL
jgi:dihydrodipicolinate synthase/N-acetylneuraminate lyase